MRNQCPKLKQGTVGNQARSRAFAIGRNEARQDPEVVTGTLSLQQLLRLHIIRF
jgi:hypothetical protein